MSGEERHRAATAEYTAASAEYEAAAMAGDADALDKAGRRLGDAMGRLYTENLPDVARRQQFPSFEEMLQHPWSQPGDASLGNVVYGDAVPQSAGLPVSTTATSKFIAPDLSPSPVEGLREEIVAALLHHPDLCDQDPTGVPASITNVVLDAIEPLVVSRTEHDAALAAQIDECTEHQMVLRDQLAVYEGIIRRLLDGWEPYTGTGEFAINPEVWNRSRTADENASEPMSTAEVEALASLERPGGEHDG